MFYAAYYAIIALITLRRHYADSYAFLITPAAFAAAAI